MARLWQLVFSVGRNQEFPCETFAVRQQRISWTKIILLSKIWCLDPLMTAFISQVCIFFPNQTIVMTEWHTREFISQFHVFLLLPARWARRSEVPSAFWLQQDCSHRLRCADRAEWSCSQVGFFPALPAGDLSHCGTSVQLFLCGNRSQTGDSDQKKKKKLGLDSCSHPPCKGISK